MTQFMKPGTQRALQKIAALTKPKCETCPTSAVFRCCDKLFCEITAVTARELGYTVPQPITPELPFMGPEGCVIPPEYRPVCAGFICPARLKEDPAFASRYEQLQERISSDPNIRRAVEKARQSIGGLTGAIERYREEHPVDVEAAPYLPGDRVLVAAGGGPGDDCDAEHPGAVVSADDTHVTVLIDGFKAPQPFARDRVMRVSSEERQL